MAADLKALAYTNRHMGNEIAQGKPSPAAERPHRKKGLITLAGERYGVARAAQKLFGYEPGDSMRAAFRAVAKTGVMATAALLGEMEDKAAENRGLAAQLFRKIAESNPHTDWDRVLHGQPEGHVKAVLASLVDDKDDVVALNAAGALGTIMKRMPCDGIGKFGEARLSLMELGKGEGVLAECGAHVRDSMPWLADEG